jgi:hypothetical protein
MSWTTLSSNDLLPYLAAAQLEALQTQALGETQTDPTPTLIADITRRIRALIAAGGYAVSATENTLPELLKGPAAALVIELAQTRIPGFSLSSEQSKQADQARALLAKISSSLVAVEAPDDPDTSLSSAERVTVVASRDKDVSSRTLRGL